MRSPKTILGFDWHQRMMPKQAEQEFKGFKFKGAGWYENKSDTLLVCEADHPFYDFWCWNEPKGRIHTLEAVAKLILLPIHSSK